LGFNDVPADTDLDTWLPGFPAAHHCLPYWFGLRNGGSAPSGNRLFMQSTSWMYCIGDPSVPYDWDPDSRPKAIGDMLAADAAAKAKAGPVTGLASRVPSERRRAAAQIRGLQENRKKALVPHLVELVTAGEWPGFDAALGVLHGMGPQARSGVPGMLAAARKALAGNRGDHVGAVLSAVAAIALGKFASKFGKRARFLAVTGLADALRGKSVGTKHRIITALAEFGAAAESAVPVLREEANAADCPAAAKAALLRIKPDADTGPESDVDIDDLF
jgi:hypothetical protein